MMALRIAISGAGGFIGSHLERQFRSLGHTVVPLCRKGPSGAGEWIQFSLGEEVTPESLRGFDVLVHCAYDFRTSNVEEDRRRNVDGSIRLLNAAHRAGVRAIVFLSTLSAYDGCKSRYGKGKLETERAVTKIGGFSLRLGFVYDDSECGLAGSLRRLVRRLPVIPIPGSGRQKLYPLSAADLAGSILAVIERGPPGGVFAIAQEQALRFGQLLRVLASEAGTRALLVPVPWRLLWLGLRGIECVGVPLSFRSDSLVSLMNQNSSPDFSLMRGLGIRLSQIDGPGRIIDGRGRL
jgi:nucleoside-diphosphate-sugar epimerase